MDSPSDKDILRARDFWGAIALFFLSVFFLWRTSSIPLFGQNRAGVSGADWYNSAALVPFGIFGALLILSLALLRTSIKAGGAKSALTAVGIGWSPIEALRFGTLAIILFFYIVGLVPRVDFIISSGLLITALIHGYHGGKPERMVLVTGFVALPGTYALVGYLPRSTWNLHADDWLTLALWAALTVWILVRHGKDRVSRIIPVIAIVAPVILVLAMAFGFRQNVPNRGGLLFKQIEYQYFVNIKPIWSR
ncbi:MAG: hypothetical protein JXQ85_08505 [Cognatishimia sp.]|uniref:hypothetical protein n=1 Tax=Cognatishimia sp. TaxID=2211648 RepID=UPI003B8C839E